MISPLAYVDPSAKIGKNVTIHPFAYIDKNVEIGDDNVIMPNASIMSGARIGNGNTIYNGAVIAATPQDFKYTGDDTIARIVIIIPSVRMRLLFVPLSPEMRLW